MKYRIVFTNIKNKNDIDIKQKNISRSTIFNLYNGLNFIFGNSCMLIGLINNVCSQNVYIKPFIHLVRCFIQVFIFIGDSSSVIEFIVDMLYPALAILTAISASSVTL